jgi:hypothetical protein
MTAAQITATLKTWTVILNKILAGIRNELLTTQEGRAYLDTAPESIRRSLKHATAYL